MNSIRTTRASRCHEIDIDKCTRQFDSKFDLILAAARRTRKLMASADPWGFMITPVDALLEAQRGELTQSDYQPQHSYKSMEELYRRHRRDGHVFT